MFYRLLLIVAIFASSLAGASIDRKITKSKQKLTETKRAYSSMDKKLARIAKKISSNRKKLKELDSIIEKLDKEIESSSKRYEEGQKRLLQIDKEIEELQKRRELQEKRLVELMANRYILGEIKRQKGVESPEDVIESETLKVLARYDSRRLNQMQQEYEKTLLQSKKLLAEAETVRKMIERLEERKAKAAKEKARRHRLEAKLKREKREYQARLEKLQKEESDLRKTLARLNILKKERTGKIKERTTVSESTKRAIASGDKIKVRTIGSSYQKHAVGRYRGKKTISPVGRAKVVKRFGSYIDPVYKIRIFNESVTLKPYRKNAKVKNVLNGKVVFVKDTKMLGKVVIIEHRNNLHTIYAKMSKIAPTIKEGKKVKKGYVIGRVEKELMFEVTQKERHINPLELITLTR